MAGDLVTGFLMHCNAAATCEGVPSDDLLRRLQAAAQKTVRSADPVEPRVLLLARMALVYVNDPIKADLALAMQPLLTSVGDMARSRQRRQPWQDRADIGGAA